MLTAEQQEHYARHLLLDEFGGEGQEKLLALSVEVRGAGVAARWAARYLAASGAGRLVVDGSFVEECSGLSPWALVLRAEARGTDGAQVAGPEATAAAGRETRIVEVADAATPAESAVRGAQAALDVLRSLA